MPSSRPQHSQFVFEVLVPGSRWILRETGEGGIQIRTSNEDAAAERWAV
ncbi:MAG TPA: hypothetical protein VN455_02270 [Methanotrichaceae archaeon]|nr:hypothetical protein [Methanotrichaceae archaeon]